MRPLKYVALHKTIMWRSCRYMVLFEVFRLCLGLGDGGKRLAGIGCFQLDGQIDDD